VALLGLRANKRYPVSSGGLNRDWAKNRLKSECVAVVGFPVVAFTEAHHFGYPGAIEFFDGFQMFEEESFEVRDFDVKIFAGAQEQPHDERFEDADSDVSARLTGCVSAFIDFLHLFVHRMLDSREEVIDDKCGINVLLGIIDGDGGESSQLEQAF
jgi:hypothetical protein